MHKSNPYFRGQHDQGDWDRNQKKLKGYQDTIDLFLKEGLGRYWEPGDMTEYNVQLMCQDPKWGNKTVGCNHWLVAWWRMNGFNQGLMGRRVMLLKQEQANELQAWSDHVMTVSLKYGTKVNGWGWADCEQKQRNMPRHLRNTVSANPSKSFVWPAEIRPIVGAQFPGYVGTR